ncbi:MAG TPA: prepilin-type N-terminal cleavage/methylation domain-containing protein [Phycisphaerales bacterium]|nr:prepilin-type N-terminal cleavage/methylation domain-containing protein [Phycisphaerales bacterium]
MPHARQRGFSLIELLVVIFVIIVIVSITIPALAAARKAARKAETQAMLTTLSQAVVQYEVDQKRTPGYFSPREMGLEENVTRGFSGMQNIMLDLMGGVVAQTTPTTGTVVEVGPARDSIVRIDTALIGAPTGTNKLYYTPGRRAMAMQDGTEVGTRNGADEHKYPELVDAFGTPVLAWVLDPTAKKQVEVPQDFAQLWSDASNGGGAGRFYWASNAAFLTAGNRVGKRGVDQGTVSMLGSGVTQPELRRRAMTGLLGNPSSGLNVGTAATTKDGMLKIMPDAARGSVVLHSAGEDGAYLPRQTGGSPNVKDNGTGQCTLEGNFTVLDFGLNFRQPDGAILTNSTDAAKKFNDIIQATSSGS